MQCYLAALHACTCSLALGTGAVSCTEWVGGGGGGGGALIARWKCNICCYAPPLFFLEVGRREGECITASE